MTEAASPGFCGPPVSSSVRIRPVEMARPFAGVSCRPRHPTNGFEGQPGSIVGFGDRGLGPLVLSRPRATTVTLPEPSVPGSGWRSGVYSNVMMPNPRAQLATLVGAGPPGEPGCGEAGTPWLLK